MRIGRFYGSLVVLGLLAWGCGDDTGPERGRDGDSDAGQDAGASRSCVSDGECDDGLFCTGDETCLRGHCLPGEPVLCHDDVGCTIDACSELTRACASDAPDLDGDGHRAASCADAAGTPLGDDCDDTDPLRFPGNVEICDPLNRDDDCDPTTLGDKDADDDGYIDARCCNPVSDAAGAAQACGDDCDDLKGAVHPDATEACDRYDNDCDMKTDEGVSLELYEDGDFDGHGKQGADTALLCAGAVGYSNIADDCDDADPEVFPGQFEICDAKDNNCKNGADEVRQEAPWFEDVDEDTFGDASSTPVYSCERIAGRVLSHNDCDDVHPGVSPAAAEACDALDNDCNGLKDFALDVNDFEDDDDDGVADDECTGGKDCDDTDWNTSAGFDETCDMRDNDCDDAIDENALETVWYRDDDGDGWGRGNDGAFAGCQALPGRAARLGDCSDDENTVHPRSVETCNGVDDDCDGRSDEGTSYQCQPANALGVCKRGACRIVGCLPGYGDSDNFAANGCEAEVSLQPLDDTECTSDVDCVDSDYCNGRERCDASDQRCYAGTVVDCNPSPTLLQGSFVIHNSLDLAALEGVQTITGNLTISAAGLRDLEGLEALRTVGGNLVVTGNDSLTALSAAGTGLVALTAIGGSLQLQANAKLSQPTLPALVDLGELIVVGEPGLVTLGGLDSLENVRGDVLISDNPKLTSLTLPKLSRVGGSLRFGPASASDTTLATISLPVLSVVGSDVSVIDLDALTQLSLGALTTIRGSLDIGLNGALTAVSLPSLATFGPASAPTSPDRQWKIFVHDNPVLASLAGLGVAAPGCPSGLCSAAINQNAALSTCAAKAFALRLSNFAVASWDANGGQLGAVQVCHPGSIYAFCPIADGALLATAQTALGLAVGSGRFLARWRRR